MKSRERGSSGLQTQSQADQFQEQIPMYVEDLEIGFRKTILPCIHWNVFLQPRIGVCSWMPASLEHTKTFSLKSSNGFLQSPQHSPFPFLRSRASFHFQKAPLYLNRDNTHTWHSASQTTEDLDAHIPEQWPAMTLGRTWLMEVEFNSSWTNFLNANSP